MIIFYKNHCAWTSDPDMPMDERAVLAAVTAALPDTPASVQINEICEYVKVAAGSTEDNAFGYDSVDWVEYNFNVQGLTDLPLEANNA